MLTREKLLDFIGKQKVALLASVDEEGFPNVKAMFAPNKIERNSLYFSTNLSSMRSQQFLKNPKACVYFYKKGRFKYEGVMLAGLVEVLQDDELRHEIWCPGDERYYPQGGDGSGLLRAEVHGNAGQTLLRLEVGEFYHRRALIIARTLASARPRIR